MKRSKTLELAYLAIFVALIFLLGLTPLGFLVLPFLPIAGITTIHMPVIIGSYSFGVKGGAILGFFFGLVSLIRCFTTPDLTATIVLGTNTGFGVYNLFLIIVIIFLPRILTGVFSALIYKALARKDKSQIFAMGVSAFVGSITNTIFFLGGLGVFAFNQMIAANTPNNPTAGALIKLILGVVGTNGIAEAIGAVIICTAVGKAIYAYRSRSLHV